MSRKLILCSVLAYAGANPQQFLYTSTVFHSCCLEDPPEYSIQDMLEWCVVLPQCVADWAHDLTLEEGSPTPM